MRLKKLGHSRWGKVKTPLEEGHFVRLRREGKSGKWTRAVVVAASQGDPQSVSLTPVGPTSIPLGRNPQSVGLTPVGPTSIPLGRLQLLVLAVDHERGTSKSRGEEYELQVADIKVACTTGRGTANLPNGKNL